MAVRVRLTAALVVGVLSLSCSSTSSLREPIAIPLATPPRPVGELVQQLAAPDAPSRASGAWALAGAGEVDATAAQALLAALEDSSEPVREAATWAVWHVTGPGIDRQKLMDEAPKVLVQGRPH